MRVAVQPDYIDEDREKFRLRLSNPSGATLGDRTGRGRITDNDGILNETGVAGEADYCALLEPESLTGVAGGTIQIDTGIIEGGVTETAGEHPQVVAEVGVGPRVSLNMHTLSDPRSERFRWSFYAAAFTAQVDSEDRYQGALLVPPPGEYSVVSRVSTDGGLTGPTATAMVRAATRASVSSPRR